MKAALYARYSTDKQSEASIPDQFRQCERLAERNGFAVVAKLSDAAISGGTAHRPGYQQLLARARAREFDVIIAEDTSRLWRNLAEQAPRVAELRDLGLHIVCHDLDTRQDSSVILGAVIGAMGEGYRQEIGRRTRRGLEGRARAQKPTGGRAYGYVAARDSASGNREINAEQAPVVIRIFELYRDGFSPRAIADKLNAEGVASPGSAWRRDQRRRAGWLGSAIAGDASRGIGILNNEIYSGRVIWNRHRWIRSASDSKRRRCVPNPQSEWVVHVDERLRIVPEDLWRAVKARQAQQAETIGARVAAGLERTNATRTGRGPKFLLSGLLRCGRCGSAYAMASARSYACAGFINGGTSACSNNARLRREIAERAVIDGVRKELAAPAVTQEILRRVRARLREYTRAKPASEARAQQLESEISNLVDAIAAGSLRASPRLAERLRTAEAELVELKAQAATSTPASIERLLPALAERYRQQLDRLPEVLAGDVTRARAALATHVGRLTVEADELEVRLYREQGHAEVALLRAAGAEAASFCGSGGRI